MWKTDTRKGETRNPRTQEPSTETETKTETTPKAQGYLSPDGQGRWRWQPPPKTQTTDKIADENLLQKHSHSNTHTQAFNVHTNGGEGKNRTLELPNQSLKTQAHCGVVALWGSKVSLYPPFSPSLG